MDNGKYAKISIKELCEKYDNATIEISLEMQQKLKEVFLEFRREEERQRKIQERHFVNFEFIDELIISNVECNPVEMEVIEKISTERLFYGLTQSELKRLRLFYQMRLNRCQIGEIEGVSEKQIRKSIEKAKNKILKNYLKNL